MQDSYNGQIFLNDYHIYMTADGSPTLSLIDKSQSKITKPESMHHSGGALTESDLVYGSALRHLIAQKPESIVIGSVGLGLGYNEIISVVIAIKENYDLSKIKIYSFELNQNLVTKLLYNLSAYLKIHKNLFSTKDTLSEKIEEPYSAMFSCIEAFYNEVSMIRVADELLKMYQNNYWIMMGALQSGIKIGQKMNCIYYDAFSSKTSPELWEQNFITHFLDSFVETEHVCFATYACTGNLKRSLASKGFNVQVLDGFQNKRHRTFATR